jgi:hypothetical protein
MATLVLLAARQRDFIFATHVFYRNSNFVSRASALCCWGRPPTKTKPRLQSSLQTRNFSFLMGPPSEKIQFFCSAQSFFGRQPVTNESMCEATRRKRRSFDSISCSTQISRTCSRFGERVEHIAGCKMPRRWDGTAPHSNILAWTRCSAARLSISTPYLFYSMLIAPPCNLTSSPVRAHLSF